LPKRLINSSHYRSAAGYLILKAIVLGLAGIVSQSLMAHALEKEDFGIVVWGWTMISILSPFGLPGISVSITSAAAQGLDRNFVRGSILELKGSLGAGLVLLAMAVAYLFRHQPTLFWIFIIAAVTIPGVLLDTPLAFWNGRENFRAMFRFSAGLRLIQLGMLVAVLRLAPHPVLVFGSQAAVAALGNLGAFFYLKRAGGLNQGYSKEFESYGWLYTWLIIGGTLSSYLDKLIVGGFFGFKNLAVFALGELIYSYVFKVPSGLVTQIFIPRLARMGLGEAVGWVKRHYWYFAGFFMLAAGIAALLLPVVYPLLFTARYAESIYFGYIFLAGVAASAPTVLLGALLKGHALKKETTMLSCFITATLLTTVTIGSLWGGVPGVAWGRVAGYAVISAAYIAMLRALELRTAKEECA
jgi:O-antigen/teichoic acid export membrane protein